jgi:hypothetical protein
LIIELIPSFIAVQLNDRPDNLYTPFEQTVDEFLCLCSFFSDAPLFQKKRHAIGITCIFPEHGSGVGTFHGIIDIRPLCLRRQGCVNANVSITSLKIQSHASLIRV